MSLHAVDLRVMRGGRKVLDAVDLNLVPGEVVAVVGPNGAGKSTLLQAMAGSLRPWPGEVLLDGVPLRAWSSERVACRRAVLAQKPTLLAPFRVEEVVGLGRHPHRTRLATDRAVVHQALERVGMTAHARTPYTRLSGGEQQRVMLARALAQLEGPHAERYLLLDEPTSALDMAWQHRVLMLASGLAQAGVGVLVVLHDLALAAAHADRIALLCRGRLLACGHPADVLRPERVQHAFGVRSRWVEVPDLGAVPVVTGVAPLIA